MYIFYRLGVLHLSSADTNAAVTQAGNPFLFNKKHSKILFQLFCFNIVELRLANRVTSIPNLN